MQPALQHVLAWSQNHVLLLNESKYVEGICHLRVPSFIPDPLSINGTALVSPEKGKYLGLFLTPNLS